MSDYSSVAPPQTNQQNFNQSSAFAAALQRAKQIAAKIHPSGQGQQGTKRTGDEGLEPENKRFCGSDYSSSNSSMSPAAMATQQAAAVAARLAQSGSNTVTEDIKLPDKIAATLSGRTGGDDQFSRLQNDSGCKLTMSRDSERVITLSGSRESVNHAKEMLSQMCSQQNCGSIETVSCVIVPPPGPGGFPPYQEVMVPGSKVGLVIGKGGETIKMLQEKTGAKMVIIQEGPAQECVEKPLRISGDPSKVEHAKQLVFDLILEKEAPFNNRGGAGGYDSGTEQAEVFVPKTGVGVVIGKGGDMIKKIQGETGCKLQFIQGKGDAPGDRRCIISGTKQQVADGKRTVEELIESVMRSNQGGGGGMNNRNNMNNTTNSNYGYGSDASLQPMREEVSFAVPASKCGIVIGRGGETIKLINQQSGAFCEMDRSAINPPSEKMFKMKGTSEQIEHARQLISEKIGVDITILSTRQIGSGGGNNNQGAYGNNGNGYGQQQQQQQQWGYQPQSWDQSQQQQQGGVQINPATGQPDYSAQWIEYYKSIGLNREAEMIEQQLKAKQLGQPTPAVVPATPGAANGTAMQQQAGQQVQAAAGGQPDYSKQWAEYYRNIGKIEEAEAIENQMKASKTAQMGANAGGMPAAVANAVPQVPGGYQAAQAMAGYNQYAQYYAGAAQPGYPQAAYGAYGHYPGQQAQMQQPGQPSQNDKN